MRRTVYASVLVALLLIGGALTAALVPTSDLTAQRAAAEAAQLEADELVDQNQAAFAASPATIAEPGRPAAPLLRATRAPELLAREVAVAEARAALTDLAAEWEQPACLAVRFGGKHVLSTGAEEPLVVASLQKLMTAAAVLEHFGIAETFETTVLAAQPPDETGALTGDVWLVGGGDPLLATQAYADTFRRQPQLRTPFESLADAVVADGVTSITGRLLADESRHPVERRVASWPARYDSQALTGRLSALTVNDGRTQFSTNVQLAQQPALWAATVLHDLLLQRGVTLDVEIAAGEAPPSAVNVATITSPPLRDIVQQMLRESDNNTAEMLLREVGLRARGEASTAAGSQVTRAVVTPRVGGDTPPTIADGSGLDPTNAATCDQLVNLLEYFGPDGVVAAGLPVAAQSGTLSHRFEGSVAAGKLRAKTGLLAGVNALAGFVDTDGGAVTFAQLLNDVDPASRAGFEAQEQLAEALVNIVNTNYTHTLARLEVLADG